ESQTIRCGSPAGGLHGARNFQGQFINVILALAERNPSFPHEPPKIAVGGDVVETVIVDADVRDVGGHALDGSFAPQLQEALLACGVKLEQRRTVLETL